MSTRETFKMARRADLASSLGLMAKNIMAASSRIRWMESENSDDPMVLFTKAALQMIN
jgi:hypothetical protein